MRFKIELPKSFLVCYHSLYRGWSYGLDVDYRGQAATCITTPWIALIFATHPELSR